MTCYETLRFYRTLGRVKTVVFIQRVRIRGIVTEHLDTKKVYILYPIHFGGSKAGAPFYFSFAVSC